MISANASCKATLLFLSFLAVIAFFAGPVGAIGLSPATVTVEDVLRGGYAERMFKVYNTESTPMRFTFKVTGDIAEWASVYPQNVFIVPPRASQVVRVVIQPGADAANGIYEGALSLEGTPEKPTVVQSGAGATIVTGVQGRIFINITDREKYQLEVLSVETPPVEERTQLLANITFSNTGNVRAKPTITIEVLDRRGQIVASIQKNDFEILPTRQEFVELRLPTQDLPPDSYSVNIGIQVRGESVYSKTYTVEIYEIGSLNRKGELFSLSAPQTAEAGSFVKVDAVFKNTGTLPSSAKLVGEVSFNGAVFAPLSSDELSVMPGDQTTLSAFFKPIQPGTYNARVWAVYNKKKTAEKAFSVLVTPSQSSGSDLLYAALALLFVLLIAVTVYALRDKLPFGKKPTLGTTRKAEVRKTKPR